MDFHEIPIFFEGARVTEQALSSAKSSQPAAEAVLLPQRTVLEVVVS